MFGLDTMLIGELPRRRNRNGLTMASCMAAFVVSFALGLGWALISLALGTRFVELNGTIGRIAVFSFGVAVTGATFVFDAATIGMLRGGLQLSRNAALSITKMVALPAASLVLHDAFGVGIMLAWTIGTVTSLVPVAVIIKRSGGRILQRPDWVALWELRKLALAHNWLNLAITTPTKLIPVLVAIVVSPSSNGAYYIATMISSFLFMVPQSLSTVLFAVASAAPEKIAEKLRFVLRMSLAIGVPAGIVIGLCAHFILSLFNSSYATMATGPLWILLVGYLPGLPNALYIAVARVKGQFNQASIFLTIFAVIRMTALVLGGKMDGLYGLSYGMLAVSLTQSLITTPYVLRSAFGSATVHPVTDSAIADEALEGNAELAEQMRIRQEAGLAALTGLATRVGPAQPHRKPDILETKSHAWMALTRPQEVASGRHRRRRSSLVPATKINRVLRETIWWPDIDEATFHTRQEAGMAALIAIATNAARF